MEQLNLTKLAQETGAGFGTSGVRGLVTQLDDRLCWAYTSAFLQAVEPTATRLALGWDLRPSSPRIARACARAATERGIEVIACGTLATPALAYFASQQDIPAVMVTGSHIPFDRNGMKFYSASGEISKADEAAILSAQVRDTGNYTLEQLMVSDAALTAYRQRYLDFFPSAFLAGQRLGLYQHSGVARDFLADLLVAFGAEVIPLGRSDTFVPIDTEAVSAADQAMAQRWSTEHQLDAILSTDGDADRPLLADEKGAWFRGDILGLLTARYLGADVVATPVSCNTAIEGCGAFTHVVRTRIGSPYVIEAMQQSAGQRRVGFEANGGFLVGSAIERAGRHLALLSTRDAVLPMLAALHAAQEQGMPLSQLAADLPARVTASDRLQAFPTTASQALLQQLMADPAAVQQLLGDLCGTAVKQDTTDGLRLTFAQGDIIHLRPSGNAPELRCYVETDRADRARTLVSSVLTRIQEQTQHRELP